MALRIVLWTLGGMTLALIGSLAAILPGRPEPPALPGRVEHRMHPHGGFERAFEVYTPSSFQPNAALVIALHGSSMDVATTRQFSRWRLEELSEREGFLLAYPLGLDLEWNGCRSPGVTRPDQLGVDDVGFVLELIDVLAAEHGLDPLRVYALGISNGGQMVYRLGHDAPERFAALAAVIAQIPESENSDCNAPRGPVPMLVMNGTADPIVPEAGGVASLFGISARGRVRSTDETMRYWLAVNEIATPPQIDRFPDADASDRSSVERFTWRGRGPRREVVLYRIHGGGHALPGGLGFRNAWLSAPLFGATNGDIIAADEILAFFSGHELTRTAWSR